MKFSISKKSFKALTGLKKIKKIVSVTNIIPKKFCIFQNVYIFVYAILMKFQKNNLW